MLHGCIKISIDVREALHNRLANASRLGLRPRNDTFLCLGNTKVGLRAILWVPEAASSPLRGYQKLYKLNKVY